MVNDDLEPQVHNEPYVPDAPVAEADVPPVEAPETVDEQEAPTSATGPARLVVKRSGAETDTEFTITSPAVIGRFDPGVGPVDVDLGGLPEGAYVSRKHAKLEFEDGVWKIKDLGSSNGTFILRDDFERVEEAELTDGQEFALGNARFVFHLA